MKHRPLAVLPIFASALMLSGCLISSQSSTTASGRTLSTQDSRSIEIGKTTGDELISSFGEPTSRIDRPDGSSTWKWCRTETRNSSGAVFLIFGGSSTRTESNCAVVELSAGVVRQVRSE
ncbi:MAG: hypothetical protein DYG92_02195 [Leptolyngbya sp. PLA1]|nr:hypothetical protein [Leptolyngbya sp. PLA1]